METQTKKPLVKTGDENPGNRTSNIGCGKECKVNSMSSFICGIESLNGKPWLCDDCLAKQDEKTCKKCKSKYNPVEDGRGHDMDNGLCTDCDIKAIDEETN